MNLPDHLSETIRLVKRAIESGETAEIEYLFNRGLCAQSDGEALRAAVLSDESLAGTNEQRLWLASLCAFLGRADDMECALDGAEGPLAEKFRALFGLAPWFENWRTRETAHFIWRHPGGDFTAFIAAREAAHGALRAFFGMDLDRKVRIFSWRSREEARAKLGRGLGFAIPQYYLIHSARDQSPGHELAHLFTHYLPDARVKSAFITEGAAVMLDQTGRDLLAEARGAMTRVGIASVDIAGLWRDFSSVHFSVSYPVAGLFCKRFLAARGKSAFLDLLRHQPYENALEYFGSDFIEFMIRDVENAINR